MYAQASLQHPWGSLAFQWPAQFIALDDLGYRKTGPFDDAKTRMAPQYTELAALRSLVPLLHFWLVHSLPGMVWTCSTNENREVLRRSKIREKSPNTATSPQVFKTILRRVKDPTERRAFVTLLVFQFAISNSISGTHCQYSYQILPAVSSPLLAHHCVETITQLTLSFLSYLWKSEKNQGMVGDVSVAQTHRQLMQRFREGNLETLI